MTKRSHSLLVALNVFLILSSAPVQAARTMNAEAGMERALVTGMTEDDGMEFVGGMDACQVLEKRFLKQESKLGERAEQGKALNKLGPMIRVFSAAKTKKRAQEKECGWVEKPDSAGKVRYEAAVKEQMKEYSNCYDKTMDLLGKGDYRNAVTMYTSETCEIELQSGEIDEKVADALEVEAEARCEEAVEDAVEGAAGSLIELDDYSLEQEGEGKLNKTGAIILLIVLIIFFSGIMIFLMWWWLIITIIMCLVNGGKRGNWGQCMGYYWNWPERVR